MNREPAEIGQLGLCGMCQLRVARRGVCGDSQKSDWENLLDLQGDSVTDPKSSVMPALLCHGKR